MEIQSPGASGNLLGASAPTGSAAPLGRDEFMALLVAKLQNQDPLEPAKDTEFISQLATFSSLEQLVSVNDNLEALGASQAELQSQMIDAQALDLIGKEALLPSPETINFLDGQAETLLFQLPRPAKEATLQLMSGSTVVATYDISSVSGQRIELDWNSFLEEHLEGIPDGTYRIEVNARDLSDDPMIVPLFRSVSIDGVSFYNGEMALVSAGREIPLNSILEIRAGR